MDNIRLLLMVAVAFLSFSLYQAWQRDYAPQPQVQQAQQSVAASSGETATPSGGDEPSMNSGAVPDVGVPAAGATPVVGSVQAARSKKISVETDLFRILIDTHGGTLTDAWLEQYPVSIKQPDVKLKLLTPVPPELFIAQSGLKSGKDVEAPTHEAQYQAESFDYKLADGQNELVVDLVWRGANGVKVTKRYRFQRDSYAITVEHIVENTGAKPWSARGYEQLQRMHDGETGNVFMARAYVGAAIYSPDEKYEKIPFNKMAETPLNRDVTGGWVAMMQHYFIGAWIPPADEPEHFYSMALPGGRYVVGAYSPVVRVAPGESHTFGSRLVIGPKLQDKLAKMAPGLELTADYGWLTILAKPMFWLLKWFHNLFGNWGWAIIFLTITIKVLFYKLSEASYRSMANMRKLAPRLKALKERYGDDKARMNQAMMEMYKKEKINPLGGCLPMLVQIPFFIALYWVLMEAVELRQAPFMLWIKDLSIADPYFVLPVLMGVTMLAQQKLNPAPMDPMQQKVMMALPVVFTVFFAFFPAGLVLYWFVNNLLSIAQQYVITKRIEASAN